MSAVKTETVGVPTCERRFARMLVDGVPVLVSYDDFGYWHAAAPGSGAMNFGSRTADVRDMTVRDALSRWRANGSPGGSRDLIPPGWTEVAPDELLVAPVRR